MYLCPTFLKCGCGEMVDTLVSGASASRRVGSTPIIRTKNPHDRSIMRIFFEYQDDHLLFADAVAQHVLCECFFVAFADGYVCAVAHQYDRPFHFLYMFHVDDI